MTARDQDQDFSFYCHFVLLFEVELCSPEYEPIVRDFLQKCARTRPRGVDVSMPRGIRTSTTTGWLPNPGTAPLLIEQLPVGGRGFL